MEDSAPATPSELPKALIVAFDADLRVVVSAGQALTRPTALSPARVGEPVEQVFPEALWRMLEPLFRSALDGETRSREIATGGGDGRVAVDIGPLHVAGTAEGGEAAKGGVAVVLDASARPRSATVQHSGRAGAGFEEVFERAPIGTGLLDCDWRWLLVNHALCEITGYTPDELIGHPLRALVPDGDVGQRERLLSSDVGAVQAEHRYVNAGGESCAAIVSMSLVRDAGGNPLHYIAQLHDISERKQLEERLRHLAGHDPLTGVRNRRLFDHDLAMQVARSKRYGELAGVLVLDLDGFKAVNDAHGHKAGDDVLRAVARALRGRLRETDLVARIGGDEFAVLLARVDESGLEVVARGLERAVRACAVDVGEAVVHPDASIGGALIDATAVDAGEVFARADRAMYAIKRARS